MADEQENTIRQQESVESIDVDISEFYFVEKVQGEGLNEKIVTSRSKPCMPQKGNLKRKIRSEGGTPVFGSGEIRPAEWVSGPPTPVHEMSPNSTAMALLSSFAQGSVKMKGDVVQHISEGNLNKLRKVTIELIQPDGELIGKIENINFLDQSEQRNESIGEMLEKLDTKKVLILNFAVWEKRKGAKITLQNLPWLQKRGKRPLKWRRRGKKRRRDRKSQNPHRNQAWDQRHQPRRKNQVWPQGLPQEVNQVPPRDDTCDHAT